MGFRYRKYNPKGMNVSLSSNGLRLSKTIKMGSMTFNLGHTLGGKNNGKTTGRATANLGNGLMYTKEKRLFNNNESLNKTFNTTYNSHHDIHYDESPWWRWITDLLFVVVIPMFLLFYTNKYLQIFIVEPLTPEITLGLKKQEQSLAPWAAASLAFAIFLYSTSIASIVSYSKHCLSRFGNLETMTYKSPVFSIIIVLSYIITTLHLVSVVTQFCRYIL